MNIHLLFWKAKPSCFAIHAEPDPLFCARMCPAVGRWCCGCHSAFWFSICWGGYFGRDIEWLSKFLSKIFFIWAKSRPKVSFYVSIYKYPNMVYIIYRIFHIFGSLFGICICWLYPAFAIRKIYFPVWMNGNLFPLRPCCLFF